MRTPLAIFHTHARQPHASRGSLFSEGACNLDLDPSYRTAKMCVPSHSAVLPIRSPRALLDVLHPSSS